MKICHVITRMIVGGAQENTLYSVRGHLENGYDAKLIVGKTEGPEGNLLDKITVPNLEVIFNHHLRREIDPVNDFLAISSLQKLFEHEAFDVVHTHSSKAGVLARIAANKANIPVIVHTVHGPSFHEYQSWWKNYLYILAERYACKFCDRQYSVAQAMTDLYLSKGIGNRGLYKTVYSGMELDPFLHTSKDLSLIKKLGITPDKPVIGKIARLFELKGYEYLLSAAPLIVRKFPEVQFLIVGDGNRREFLEREIENLGLSQNFFFAGLIEPSEIFRYFSIMDIVVHLSLREGLPRAIIQAMASGLPAVGFNLDGTPEAILDGETGYLCEPKDWKGVANAVNTLLENPTLIEKMGEKGREFVKERWDWRRMVKTLEQDYKSLLETKTVTSI